MKPQHTLGRASTPDGGEIVLYERDGAYTIRVNGFELMTSRAHGSEEDLARLTLGRLTAKHPKILVGGLGMGYTLRAVLDVVPPSARVMVAEILPTVIAWNRDELAHLAHSPLEDPRVAVVERDVAEIIGAGPAAFDAVLLDVDNGPAALSVKRNDALYSAPGLAAIRCCLRSGGVLGVWSADPDRAFEKRLRKAGFQLSVDTVAARRGAKGPKHTIFVATLGRG
jgi:spermidine synthase